MELVSRCVECGLAEPESLASLGGSAPGVVDGILSVKHCQFIVEHFNANHVVLASGQLFQDEEILHQLDNNPDCVVVTYPWPSNGESFMGVPPHVAVLQELNSTL